MVLCAYDALEANEQSINELNVFPVPDGDTGTNMRLTLGSAATDLRQKSAGTVGETAARVASAELRGARGNSGVILSLLFRGLSKGLKGLETATAADYAKAMTSGVEAAYKAVMKPAEGTILTVSRLAAEAAVAKAKESTGFEEMIYAALESGKAALEDTVNQNPVLKKAGVVDAGGYGYILMLEAMLGWLEGRVEVSQGPGEAKAKAGEAGVAERELKYLYCTEFIVRRANKKSLDLLRAYMGNLGDSIVMVEGEETVKVHLHTNAPGRILTQALTYGSLAAVKVENMREQHRDPEGHAPTLAVPDEKAPAQPEEDHAIPEPVPAEKPVGTVCVCAGDGLEELFRQLGADGIVSGGQTMNPATEDILRAVNLTPADTVFVFPNNKNIIMAAEQCVPMTTKKVIVIPSRTVCQGISAMMRLSPDSDEQTLEQEFNDALQTVHTIQITYAARDSEFDGHSIKAGEYLTLMDGQLVGSFADTASLVDGLDPAIADLSPEFVTVYYGADVAEKDAEDFSGALGAKLPDAETSLIRGGQPVYYYMISVE